MVVDLHNLTPLDRCCLLVFHACAYMPCSTLISEHEWMRLPAHCCQPGGCFGLFHSGLRQLQALRLCTIVSVLDYTGLRQALRSCTVGGIKLPSDTSVVLVGMLNVEGGWLGTQLASHIHAMHSIAGVGSSCGRIRARADLRPPAIGSMCGWLPVSHLPW